MINGIVRRWDGTVTARIQRLELVVDVDFFACLQSREQTLVLVLLKFASVQVDGILSFNPVAMHLEQPVDAVRCAAFFISR